MKRKDIFNVKISHCSPKIYVLADLMSTGQFALCDCSYEVINISIYLYLYTRHL